MTLGGKVHPRSKGERVVHTAPSPTQLAWLDRERTHAVDVLAELQPDGTMLALVESTQGRWSSTRLALYELGRRGRVDALEDGRGRAGSPTPRRRVGFRSRVGATGKREVHKLYLTSWEKFRPYIPTMHDGLQRHRWDDPDHLPGEVPIWAITPTCLNHEAFGALEEVEARVAAEQILAELPRRHSAVLRARFLGMTLAEIGADLDVTRERVRQLEHEAISAAQRIAEGCDPEEALLASRWRHGA